MNAPGGKTGGTGAWDPARFLRPDLGARIAKISTKHGIAIDGPCRIGGDLGPGAVYAVWIPEDDDELSGLQLTAEDEAGLLEKLERYLGHSSG